jgi:DNA polymerase I
MRIDLQPDILLEPGTFNAVIAPVEVISTLINTCEDLRRYLFLFVCGNFSRVLPAVNRTAPNFEIRRAFTAYQLATILSEASHTVILIEHDPGMFEGARDMIGVIAQTFRQLSCESTILLFTPAPDPVFRSMIRDANRIYYLHPPVTPVPGRSFGNARFAGCRGYRKEKQTTLDVEFSQG